MNKSLFCLTTIALMSAGGCVKNATLIPNADGTLNRTATSFAAQAVKLFPYPAQAQPGGEIRMRAEVGYMWNVLTLSNFSGKNWEGAQLWINQRYVVQLDSIEQGKAKQVAFKMIYNDQGEHLPHKGIVIETVQLYKDGMIYDIPKQIGG
jgi:hypothetical protein